MEILSAAQNMGAGKHARVKQGFRAGLAVVWIICVPVCALYLIAGKYLMYAFLDDVSGVALAEVLALTPLGTTGIWMAWPCGWCVSAVLSIIFYRGGAWNKMPDAENKEEEIVREEEELEEETEGDGL